MNKFWQGFCCSVWILGSCSAWAASSSGSSASSASTSQCTAPSGGPSAGGSVLPQAIQSAISTGISNYIQDHCPPDPASILAYTCGNGDNFCTNEEALWTQFLSQYNATQAMSTLNLGNQAASSGSSTSGSSQAAPSGATAYGF